MMEKAFAQKVIHPRVILLCQAAVGKMKLELNVRGLAPTRSGYIILLINALLPQLLEWLNEKARLQNRESSALTLADMYRYLAFFLFSHTTGLSFEMTIEILRLAGGTAPSLETVRFVAQNICAYSPTGRGQDESSEWNTQRDQTRKLSEFEGIAFRDSKKIFFCPMYMQVTLDDDLFGTRAADNQVKTISSKKVDKEVNSADAIADAKVRFMLAIRFRRRGESETDSVRKLVSTLVDGRGEEALSGCIVTADRGYGKEAFIKILMDCGLASVFVMPDHLLRVHPFVARSYMNPARADIEDEAAGQIDSDHANESGDESGQAVIGGESSAQNSGVQGEVGESADLADDRRKEFVIDDDPSMGPDFFYATKNIGAGGSRLVGTNKMTAIAVREHGTNMFAKVLRFAYTVPPGIVSSLNTWVAVPRLNFNLERTLFVTRAEQDDENLFVVLRSAVECFIKQHCDVLKIGQRCADWFVLRQFRVTGTNAGLFIMESEDLQSLLGCVTEAVILEKTLSEWFDVLYKGWFSSKVSTEPMMRGISNEAPVVQAVSRQPFVKDVLDVEILGKKTINYLACSPDSIAVVDLSEFGDWNQSAGVFQVSGQRLYIATVEIKTRVSAATVGQAVKLSSADLILCEVGDNTFKRYVPREHRAQVLQQMVVVNTIFSIYVLASETGILYTVLMRCPEATLSACQQNLLSVCSPLVSWAHTAEFSIPAFVDREKHGLIDSRHKFWWTINSYVKDKGPFDPLKLFKHAAQSFYSKTKGGVDGATQQRAILRSPTSHLKWEQKIVSQIIKTVCINAFIAWRIFIRQDLLHSEHSCKSLDNYRSLLNKVQTTSDFMYQVSQELLTHADRIQLKAARDEGDIQEPESGEIARLIAIDKIRKRKRLTFFNSADGIKLRLQVRGHAPIQGQTQYCTLCGQHTTGFRGHQTLYRCSMCSAFLFVRRYDGLRKSCWSIWRESKTLKLRQTPEPSRNSGESVTGNVSVAVPQQEDTQPPPSQIVELNLGNRARRRRSGESSSTSERPQKRRRAD